MQEVERRILTARDGRVLYVEPSAVASNGREVLIAGWPTVVWSPAADSTYQLQMGDSVFGVIVAPGQYARIIPMPPDVADTVDGVRAVANIDGSWTVLWFEVDSIVGPGIRWRVRRLRAGTVVGNQWVGSIETLPIPPGVAGFNYTWAEPPILAGDSVVWAITASIKERMSRGLLYVRHRGAWRVDYLPTSTVTYATPGWSPSSGLVMAVVRPDTTLPSDANSLFLFTHRGTWRVAQRIALGGETPTYAPQWVQTPRGLMLGWNVQQQGVSGWPVVSALLASDSIGEARSTFQQEYLAPRFLGGPEGVPLWLTQHARDSVSEARVSAVLPEGAGSLGSIRNPAMGLLIRIAFVSDAPGRQLVLIGKDEDRPGGRPRLFTRLVEARLDCIPIAP